jgi:DNA polymerase-3 subunit epsilon
VEFIAIDVETACSGQSSICQIGIAIFQSDRLIHCERRYINPETQFLSSHIKLHGISNSHVTHAPTWKDIYPELRRVIGVRTIINHTFFDRAALMGVCRRYGCSMFSYVRWIDTCAVARRTWPGLASHALPSLARHFEIEYRSHDAGEDARVSGQIFLLCLKAQVETEAVDK